MSLRHRDLRETHNYGLGVGGYSGTGGKDTKQRRQVGEGGGEDRRQAVGGKDRRRTSGIANTEFQNTKQSLMTDRLVIGNTNGLKRE